MDSCTPLGLAAVWSSELSERRPRAIAVVGTTASGKSALALRAAEAAEAAEIISVDSMAVYREMDIGTAKPSKAERDRVPHHLIDILDPSEECTVSLFQAAARSAIDDVADRGAAPLLVGGTGLYHRAVIDNLEIPGQFPEVRLELEQRAASDLGGLHRELLRLDPLAAGRIEPQNERRIVRALEVIGGTGRPFSSFGPGLEHYGESEIQQVGLRVAPARVDEAIEARVSEWMATGFLEEVAALSQRPGGLSRTARQAIGYAELLAHLNGECSLEDATKETVRRTRAFARRQRSWFNRDPRIEWFDDADELFEVLVSHLDDLVWPQTAGAVGD